MPDPLQSLSGVGSHVAKAHMVVSFALLEWTERHGQGLKAIYFDKLAELIARVWNSLADENDEISWRFPYESRRGIHGPGQATRINRSEEEVASCGRHPEDPRHNELAYFGEIAKRLGDRFPKLRLFETSLNEWEPDCVFTSAMPMTDWNELRKKRECELFPALEADAIVQFAVALATIDEEGLRALGTHSSNEQTLGALAFNYAHWRRYCNEAVDYLVGGRRPTCVDLGKRLRIVTEEIRRKSTSNQSHYESAREQMGGEIGAGPLRDAFFGVQHEGSEVWTGQGIDLWRRAVEFLEAFTTYISCVLNKLDSSIASSEADSDRLRRAVNLLETRMKLTNVIPMQEVSRNSSAALVQAVNRIVDKCDERVLSVMPELLALLKDLRRA